MNELFMIYSLAEWVEFNMSAEFNMLYCASYIEDAYSRITNWNIINK